MITPLGFEFRIAPTIAANGSAAFVERWRRYYGFYHICSGGLLLIAAGIVIGAIVDKDPGFAEYAAIPVAGAVFCSAIGIFLGRRVRIARASSDRVEWTVGADQHVELGPVLHVCDVMMRNYHTGLPWWIRGRAVILATPTECMTVMFSTRQNRHELAAAYVASLPSFLNQRVVDEPRTLKCWSVRRQ